jgi:hypothetical protein
MDRNPDLCLQSKVNPDGQLIITFVFYTKKMSHCSVQGKLVFISGGGHENRTDKFHKKERLQETKQISFIKRRGCRKQSDF